MKAAVMIVICVLAHPALAQEPWRVTVTPTMNPLPIGSCAAVHLNVRDSSGADVPRNPQGQRVTVADFDMVVASPDGASVVGRHIDAYHWLVCGCQGAALGTRAIITASYPSRSLSAEARVPGASIQVTADFELGASKGVFNPPGCPAPGTTAVSAAVSRTAQPDRVAGAVQPVSPPVPVTPTPAPKQSIPKGEIAARVAPYQPAPVTVTLDLSAAGSWFVPSPVTVALDISAEGSWYVPAPVTVTLDISATGNWLGLDQIPGRTPQPAPSPR